MFLAAVAVLGVLIFLLSLAFPSTARMERSGSINAPLDKVYAQVSDLQTWPQWNPWNPGYNSRSNILLQYSEPSNGTGAWYTWSNTAGSTASGRVEVVTADPAKGIQFNMTDPSMKPVKGYIELKPTTDGKGTAILWRLEANVGLAPWWKLRGFLMDRLYGPSMEEGLNRLRDMCEGR
jgi:hypothetical protein